MVGRVHEAHGLRQCPDPVGDRRSVSPSLMRRISRHLPRCRQGNAAHWYDSPSQGGKPPCPHKQNVSKSSKLSPSGCSSTLPPCQRTPGPSPVSVPSGKSAMSWRILPWYLIITCVSSPVPCRTISLPLKVAQRHTSSRHTRRRNGGSGERG